jgi:tuberous sclerosis 2
MASLVSNSLKNRSVGPYANNWLERLRKIKHLKNKLETKPDSNQQISAATSTSAFLKDVFTKYT